MQIDISMTVMSSSELGFSRRQFFSYLLELISCEARQI